MRRALCSSGLGLCLLALLFACDDDPFAIPDLPDAEAEPPPPAGVGAACDAVQSCRTGLECQMGACAPAGSSIVGDACVINGECRSAACVAGMCVQAVAEGAPGTDCGTDADCAAGLRCAVRGFSARCQPEGAGDAGDPCAAAGECLGGLGCFMGVCNPPPPGVSPALGGAPFGGVECAPAAEGPVRAWFELPGVEQPAGEYSDFFRLPFPNDALIRDGRLDLEGFPTPGDAALGFDPVGIYVDALRATASGWGTYPTVFFRFSGPIDFRSFRPANGVSPVQWVDITEGAPERGRSAGLFFFSSGGGGRYVCPNWFGIRRPRGAPLLPGHSYAVWLTTEGVDNEGRAIDRSPHLEALLAPSAPPDPRLRAAYERYAGFRAFLDEEGVDPGTILNATVITVEDHRAPMRRLARSVEEAPATRASEWVRCGEGPSPCPDATGPRACAEDPGYAEFHALIELPIFQRGAPPYLEIADGGDVDPAQVQRRESVCAALTVPVGQAPGAGWPVALYAHGTGGHFRSHARPEVAGALATAGLAVLGVDQVQHGTRRGGSTEDPKDLFFNFANPLAARGNPMQGGADQVALGRFLAAMADDPATPAPLDAGALVFWGHSQGATHGSLGVPFSDVFRGAVLSGNGASLMDALLTKRSPVDIAQVVPQVLQDPNPDGTLYGGDMHPALTVVQHWIDPADPLNFARRMALDPPEGRDPKHLFQPYGLGDTFSPPATMETYAVAGALGQAAADPTAGTPDELRLLEPQPVPLGGNLDVRGQPVTAVLRQYGPPAGRDGHFVAFDVPSANAEVVRFLAATARGEVPRVGE